MIHMGFAPQVCVAILIIGLAIAARFWIERARRGSLPILGGQRKARSFEVIDRVVLSPQHTLHLVRLQDHALVVAVHAGGCSMLEAVRWPGCAALGQSASPPAKEASRAADV
jgi:flagellar biogenesis protein FliO